MTFSGTSTVHYYDSGTFVGERRQYSCGYRSDSGESESAYWPDVAYFCPVCGEIWGRMVYIHQFQYTPRVSSPWAIESRRCAQHGDGCFLTGLVLEDCSRELLFREFTLLSQR